jgi:2-dehydropantoate 2-reductase
VTSSQEGLRLLVVGAGATGGYFGGRLAQAGRDVTFLLRPARATAIRSDGLQIISQHGDVTLAPTVVEVGGIDRKYDLILLCVKADALEQAMADLAPAVGPDTLILPVLNGMRHLDLLVDRFGRAAVLGGVCVVSTTLDEQGRVVQLASMQELTYGALDPAAPVARLGEVDAVLQDAGFTARLSASVVAAMWQKWVMLASAGALNVLLRGTVGEIVAVPDGLGIAREMVAEAVAIAAAAGQPLSAGAWRRIADMVTEPGSSFTTSMYRDLLAGRPVESEAIIGDLVDRAEELGVATPLLRLAGVQLAIHQRRLGGTRPSAPRP